MYEWSDLNNMQLNGDKFVHLRYGCAPPGMDNQYLTPDGNPIGTTDRVVDLGVVMENNAKFNAEIRSIAEKGKRTAGWILRVFSTRRERPMIVLFKALVLSLVEYCSVLWSPKTLA